MKVIGHTERGARIFVNSMSDLFHEAVADEEIHLVLAVMAMTYEPSITKAGMVLGWRQRHTYQVLTKRAERMRRFMAGLSAITMLPPTEQLKHPFAAACQRISRLRDDQFWQNAAFTGLQWVDDGLPGLWLGVSAEDQIRADERVPLLLQTPAGGRFVSIEPMLGPITLMHVAPSVETATGSIGINALTGEMVRQDGSAILGRAPTQSLDWVIVGGESGPKARPMHPDWVRDLHEECEETKTPFFFKQWGEWAPGENTTRTRGIVETADWFNGLWHFGHENLARQDGHRDDEPDLYRVGKKEAGAHLDGRLHREFPG